MKKLLRMLAASVVLLLTACVQPEKQKPIITVTIEPQKYFAEKIAGDKFDIHTMVPGGSSPESFDPSPGALVNLSHSSAYFRIGYIGFEMAWMDKLQRNHPELKVYDNSQGIELIENSGHTCSDPSHHHEMDLTIDPHIWTSAANGEKIARNMLSAFIELDPDNKSYYEDNFNKLQQEIRQTNDSVHAMLDDQRGDAFIIYHPALTYLAQEYGLKQYSIENQGKEPSAASLKSLIDQVRESGAKVVFIQQEFDEKNARVIADELGLKVVQINPLSYNWNQELIDIAKALDDK
ncbi:MAG: metal ABC transporter solute-binding protein, Zn/Mn family [Bacteroidales bacterium]